MVLVERDRQRGKPCEARLVNHNIKKWLTIFVMPGIARDAFAGARRSPSIRIALQILRDQPGGLADERCKRFVPETFGTVYDTLSASAPRWTLPTRTPRARGRLSIRVSLAGDFPWAGYAVGCQLNHDAR